MVSDIWQERKPAATTWATHSDYQQGFFYMHLPTNRKALCYTSRGALAGTRNDPHKDVLIETVLIKTNSIYGCVGLCITIMPVVLIINKNKRQF